MDAHPNAARGEAGLSVGGEKLMLRPSFSALVAAEEELGSLFALVERAADGKLRLGEIAGLFWHCAAARPEALTRERLGEAVAEQGLAKVTPVLWQHESGKPIGRIDYLREDRRGLRVIARLSESAAGREAAALLNEGAVTGLSFGYRVRAAEGFAPRELIDLDLVEVSLVTLPMQPKARVHALERGGT